MGFLLAKLVLCIGIYALLAACIHVANQSAIYFKDEYFLYAIFGVSFISYVVPVSIVLFFISFIRKEQPRTLLKGTRLKVTGVLLGALLLYSFPTIRNQYYLAKYDINVEWQWTGGSENFNLLRVNDVDACELSTKLKVHFDDVNNDGYADIVYSDNVGDAILYNPSTKSFDNCPFLGG